jgi:hypothetical protein
MRKVAAVPEAMAERTGMRRLMLADAPDRYSGMFVVYAYMLPDPDGPSFTGWLFESAADAVVEMESWGIAASNWRDIPDQLPGCQPDWIGPVRIPRAADGGKLYHQWERLEGGAWVPFDGPAGGYGFQIDSPPG